MDQADDRTPSFRARTPPFRWLPRSLPFCAAKLHP